MHKDWSGYAAAIGISPACWPPFRSSIWRAGSRSRSACSCSPGRRMGFCCSSSCGRSAPRPSGRSPASRSGSSSSAAAATARHSPWRGFRPCGGAEDDEVEPRSHRFAAVRRPGPAGKQREPPIRWSLRLDGPAVAHSAARGQQPSVAGFRDALPARATQPHVRPSPVAASRRGRTEARAGRSAAAGGMRRIGPWCPPNPQ